ncbi:MAG: YkgJ family cysteine cluster protein [Desulfurococcaceae archaeon]|jgi:Fe-S-cluster containining protein|nr:YkgJ family cysteine cluster protein [Desulfurococcaceae archaeon]
MTIRSNPANIVDGIKLHRLTKEALRGNIEALYTVLKFLKSFRIPSFNVIAYLIIYQVVMNVDNDLANECRRCGGICCKSGQDIPLYPFDLEDLEKKLGSCVSSVVKKVGDNHYLPRPCVFQSDWRCTIHQYKPYACLSYPFASEDVQQQILINTSSAPPEPIIPDFCLAAKKIWSRIKLEIDKFQGIYGRAPTPLELLNLLLEKGSTAKQRSQRTI